jgi:pimeloyl-ACP methyl ester carboxylesterase
MGISEERVMTSAASEEGWSFQLVTAADGRAIEVLTYGTGEEGALVFHHGSPGGLAPRYFFADVCDRFGLRFVMIGRPGYGLSDPRPGRVAASIPEDVARVLDELGIDTFVSVGCSGGGPHVLACAALLPERCLAAACVVGPAPIDADGLDYYEGMAPENREEWLLAEQGRDAVAPWLERVSASLRGQSIDVYRDQYGSGVPDVDARTLAGGYGAVMQASVQKAISTGMEGWLEDDVALVTPWGFDPRSITTPVAVWAGRQDTMVSWEHSAWIARAIPGADLHVLADHGHLSIQVGALTDIVEDLLAKSKR